MPPPRRRLFVATLILTLLAVASPSPSHCQSATTGALGGAVTDPAGAALPHVTVTLANSATMASQTAVTSASGAYAFSLLSPGAYAVQFAAPGFKTALMSSVAVNIGEAPTLDAALERGIERGGLANVDGHRGHEGGLEAGGGELDGVCAGRKQGEGVGAVGGGNGSLGPHGGGIGEGDGDMGEGGAGGIGNGAAQCAGGGGLAVGGRRRGDGEEGQDEGCDK